ncbi:MAG TPA: AraC family transcriptional regulator [Fimbriimonadaceae bacterium]
MDRNNPDRSKPFSLEILPPSVHGLLARIHVIGVFALHAAEEQPGTMGASITVGEDRDPVAKIELINGRHYSDAYDLRCVGRLTGDGASIETVGATTINDKKCRVDLLTIDVMKESTLKPIRIRDFGTPASFVIYDLFYEFSPIASCPFKTRSGGVALSELAAVVRVGDRVTLRSALDQLEAALQKSGDLDEAKGEALTFLAVVTAAMLEMGGPRSMHRIQLESARKLDSLKTIDQVITETRTIVENTVSILTGTLGSPSAILVDRALSILNRNFAKNLTDGSVAEQLNLSTSHFRYLFKEVTGQPFHKYLIALRLERARKLLLEANMPVSEVAAAVGFNGLAHFSRAFAQRFAVSPTNLRRSGVTVPE